VIIDGAAHMPNLESPAEINAALGLFLDALRDAPAMPGHGAVSPTTTPPAR
jgi:hypothetical protein